MFKHTLQDCNSTLTSSPSLEAKKTMSRSGMKLSPANTKDGLTSSSKEILKKVCFGASEKFSRETNLSLLHIIANKVTVLGDDECTVSCFIHNEGSSSDINPTLLQSEQLQVSHVEY